MSAKNSCSTAVEDRSTPVILLLKYNIFQLLFWGLFYFPPPFLFFFPRRAFHRKEEVCDKTIENDVVKVSQRQLTYGAKNFLGLVRFYWETLTTWKRTGSRILGGMNRNSYLELGGGFDGAAACTRVCVNKCRMVY